MLSTQGKVLAVAAATLSLTLVLPAHANVQRFTDARNHTASSVDIWSVAVDNSTSMPHKVVVVVRQDDVRNGDSITIYVDTRGGDPGPEYSIGAYTGSEYFMSRRERWRGSGKPVPFDCGYSVKIHARVDLTRAIIPRSCLGFPGRVRVAVKAERGYPVTSRDWAKARQTWLPWVRR